MVLPARYSSLVGRSPSVGSHLSSMLSERTSQCPPSDWTKQLILQIYKKGSQSECDNFRGIALLIVPSKVFTKVISNRLKPHLELFLHESKCGFRKGHGCNDQIFLLRILTEKTREFHQPLCVLH